ncbi:MAG: hypothetical protein RIG62_26255 [Cyclobacteriaceae bacterium]
MSRPLRIALIVGLLSIIILPLLFYGLVLWNIHSSSGTCKQMVIDSNEWLSGIDIPKVTYANCYYNEAKGIRTSVYRLNTQEASLVQYVQQYSFEVLTTTPVFQDVSSLTQAERFPEEGRFYRASGQKEHEKWQYIVDVNSGRLRVENQSR